MLRLRRRVAGSPGEFCWAGALRHEASRQGRFTSYLQHVALAGYELVQYRVDKEAEEEPRNQSGYDHDGERPLRVRADAVREAAGSRPRQATSAVIMIGRNLSSDASSVALRMPFPSRRSLLM